jgi:hypothetical protein
VVVATGWEADTSELVELAAPAVRLLDPVRALREVVPKMRVAGAQVVVVLSHLFWEQAEQVARQVDGVNVILGSRQGPPTGYLAEPEVIRARSCPSRATTWRRSASSTWSSAAPTDGWCRRPPNAACCGRCRWRRIRPYEGSIGG